MLVLFLLLLKLLYGTRVKFFEIFTQLGMLFLHDLISLLLLELLFFVVLGLLVQSFFFFLVVEILDLRLDFVLLSLAVLKGPSLCLLFNLKFFREFLLLRLPYLFLIL